MARNLAKGKMLCETDIRLYFDRAVHYFPDNRASIDEGSMKHVAFLIASKKLAFTQDDLAAMDGGFPAGREIKSISLHYRHGGKGRWINASLPGAVFIDSAGSGGKLEDIEMKLVAEAGNADGGPEFAAFYGKFEIPGEWQALYDMNVNACDKLAGDPDLSLEDFKRHYPALNGDGSISWEAGGEAGLGAALLEAALGDMEL
ncbi:MAG: hypothetical protein FWG91_03795 [Lachnospiraceae bacterium]|nr:hypothetical protein [Lachnospiraceae bacterium]